MMLLPFVLNLAVEVIKGAAGCVIEDEKETVKTIGGSSQQLFPFSGDFIVISIKGGELWMA